MRVCVLILFLASSLIAADKPQRPGSVEAFVVGISPFLDDGVKDQVYRSLTFYLCGPCYREWIENPTG